MSEKTVNPYNVQGISFESEELLNNAKQRAESFGLSLSNYVCQLVKNDLDDCTPAIVRPRPKVPRIAPPTNPVGERVNPALNEPSAPYQADTPRDKSAGIIKRGLEKKRSGKKPQ